MELLAAEKHQVEALKNMQHRNKSLSMLDEILEDVRRAADRLELEIEEHAFDDNKAVSGPRAPCWGVRSANKAVSGPRAPVRCANKEACGCAACSHVLAQAGNAGGTATLRPRKGLVWPRGCAPVPLSHPTPAAPEAPLLPA